MNFQFVYRVTQKKVGLVIAVILASKIIFKVTPILLDNKVPYRKVILSYWFGLCHYWFIFYGYFSLGGPGYFWLNKRILYLEGWGNPESQEGMGFNMTNLWTPYKFKIYIEISFLSFITSKTSNVRLLATFPNLLHIFFCDSIVIFIVSYNIKITSFSQK